MNAQRILLSRNATQESFYRGPASGEDGQQFYSMIREYLARKDQPREDNNMEVLSDGSIKIPACAFVRKNNCQPMKSFGVGGQVLMKNESSLEYKMPGRQSLVPGQLVYRKFSSLTLSLVCHRLCRRETGI